MFFTFGRILALSSVIVNITSFPRSGSSFFTTTLLGFDTQWSYPNGLATFQPVQLFSGEDAHFDVKKCPYLYPQQMDPNPAARIADVNRVFVYKRHDHPDNYTGPRIYLVRDGRDVMVSYARHNLTHRGVVEDLKAGRPSNHERRFDKKAYLEELERLVETGGWGDFVMKGVLHRNTKAIVHYEDMLEEPVKEATYALLRCGYIVTPKQAPPSFEELHKMAPWFYRNGKANDYTSSMPMELIKRFEEKNKEALTFLGYL